ncbi:MAG: hypothetical protein JST91_14370 [Actinobacteria bacterium]|nr:hypothetical protein [Actinomycetota bacterium]
MNGPSRYGSIAFSAPVAARQAATGSINDDGPLRRNGDDIGTADRLSTRIAALIGVADSFFMATVTPTGWPYLQHRGGPVTVRCDRAVVVRVEIAGLRPTTRESGAVPSPSAPPGRILA